MTRIPLARVHLRENIARPSKKLGDMSNGLDHVFFGVQALEYPMLAKQAQGRAYELEFRPEMGVIALRHPEADHEALVPLADVRHMMTLPAQTTLSAGKGKAA